MARLLAAAVAATLGAGCGHGPTGPARRTEEARRAPSVRATATPIAGSCVSARIEISADRARDVRVRYGIDTTYGHETPWLAIPTDGRLTTTLLGLEPGAVTHFQVVGRAADWTTAASNDSTVTTPPWDVGLPRIKIRLDKETTGDYVLLSMNDKAEGRGLAVMIDRKGRIVWYRWGGPLQYAFDRLPNGHFIQHHLGITAFEEVGLDGSVIRTWRDPNGEWGADGHDYQYLAGDRALLFGGEIHDLDSRRFFSDGSARGRRVDNVVSEVTADGTSVWKWSSFSHVSEAETTDDPAEPIDHKTYEIVHLNTIEPLPDGNLWLSFRNTSTVVKIDRRTGNVLWRLGGKLGDFRFVDDPLDGFFRQHDSRRLSNGNVLLFDNGNLHDPPESRAVEYRLDEKEKTATLVWQYRRVPPLFAQFAGSARRSSNGHTLIAYGPNGVVSEVDADANPVWELVARRFGVYRAIAVPSLYP